MPRLLLALCLLGCHRPHEPDELDVDACLKVKVWDLEGWRLKPGRFVETFPEKGQKIIGLSTFPGLTYRFLGCADDGVVDLDLGLFDARGQLMQADTTEDRQPTLELVATGHAQVRMRLVVDRVAQHGTEVAAGAAIVFQSTAEGEVAAE